VPKLQAAEAELFRQLARPSEAEIETQVRHAVFPLLAVIAG
jgi:hypothetical protein